jgi:broad specificity phosphatase PhoE
MLSSIEGNVQEDAKDGRTKKTVVYQGTGQMMPASNITTTAWPTNFLFMAVGAVAGSVVAWMLTERKCNKKNRNHEQADSDYNRSLLDKRERLPSLVLLLRHGESEANADNTLFRLKPDNQINLTTQGRAQARDAGRRIEKFFQRFETETNRMIQRVHIHVSPFERTLQTSAEARRFFEHRVVRTQPESRIREQEFGNMSNKDSAEHREEQKKVGRFWYRFPTGESGCDVLDRVKSWWSDSFLTVNERVGYDPIDAVVVSGDLLVLLGVGCVDSSVEQNILQMLLC